jgi:hypothetical protein
MCAAKKKFKENLRKFPHGDRIGCRVDDFTITKDKIISTYCYNTG